MGRCDFELVGDFFVKFQALSVRDSLYFHYFLLNLREKYVASGEIYVQCGDEWRGDSKGI